MVLQPAKSSISSRAECSNGGRGKLIGMVTNCVSGVVNRENSVGNISRLLQYYTGILICSPVVFVSLRESSEDKLG